MVEALQEKNTAQTRTIKILIADDHPLVRRALRSLIETQPKMRVVAEACNGIEAVDRANELLPDVVIMDIGMPLMNGLEATRQIKTNHPGIAILVLTVHTDKEHVIGILEAGAAGYLTKVAFDDDIICAIQAIVAGEVVLAPSIMHQILSSHNSECEEGKTLPSFNNLSSRDILILKMAAKGLSNKNIAAELKLSEGTVKSYLVTIFSKINVSSRTEAVITGLKAGFISIRDLA
jgi:two-component system, NarL family, response regulator LiaR